MFLSCSFLFSLYYTLWSTTAGYNLIILLYFLSTFNFTLWCFFRCGSLGFRFFSLPGNNSPLVMAISQDFKYLEYINNKDKLSQLHGTTNQTNQTKKQNKTKQKQKKSSNDSMFVPSHEHSLETSSQLQWCFWKISKYTMHTSMHHTDGIGKTCQWRDMEKEYLS